MHGALINGLETRVNQIEIQLSDLDARGSEEHDNLANERDLHRFILTGEFLDFVWLMSCVVYPIIQLGDCHCMWDLISLCFAVSLPFAPLAYSSLFC